MKQTISTIKKAKNQKKLTVLTAYDAVFSRLFEPYVDMILVGDSLAMSFAGEDDTLACSMDQMIYHTKAVCKGAPESFVITDMPFGSIANNDIALQNAIKVYTQTKASAIKIEGGEEKAPLVKHLCSNGIAVMGHIGLLPQNVRGEGGYKVKGKDEQSAAQLLRDAKAIEEAGAFCIVIEGVKPDVATMITQNISIPTIGIGAGSGTDGQVLVFSDMLGLIDGFKPKFVRTYLEGAKLIQQSVQNYVHTVQEGTFPSESESY